MMDDLVTIFLTSGKKVTGDIVNDFVLIHTNDIRGFTFNEQISHQDKEVVIKEHIEFIRKARPEEAEYYRTHHYKKEDE